MAAEILQIGSTTGDGLPGALPVTTAPVVPLTPPTGVAPAGDPLGTPGATPPVAPQFAGKFGTAQDLEAAYLALQADHTQKAQALAAATAAGTPPVVPAVPPAGAPAGTPAPLNLETYYAEYAQTGTLAPTSIQAIQASTGLDAGTIQTHMQAMGIMSQQYLGEGHNRVGGEANYQAITNWAAQASPADLQVVNEQLRTGDKEAWLMSMDSLKIRYDQAMGTDPTNPATGFGGSSAASARGYAAHDEMVKDMAAVDAEGNNKYDTDPEFRRQVTERVAVSSFDGIRIGTDHIF